MRFPLSGLILLFLFFSCASPAPTGRQEKPDPPLSPVSGPTASPQSALLSEKGSAAEQILLRDILSNEVTPLSVIADGKPAILDLSASWCAPCAELPGRLNSVRNRFGQPTPIVVLMVLQKGDSPERLPAPPGYPIYLLEKAPASLEIAPPSLLPTVLVLDAKGSVRSFLAGLYPALVYYSAISEVLTEE